MFWMLNLLCSCYPIQQTFLKICRKAWIFLLMNSALCMLKGEWYMILTSIITNEAISTCRFLKVEGSCMQVNALLMGSSSLKLKCLELSCFSLAPATEECAKKMSKSLIQWVFHQIFSHPLRFLLRSHCVGTSNFTSLQFCHCCFFCFLSLVSLYLSFFHQLAHSSQMYQEVVQFWSKFALSISLNIVQLT